MGFRGAVRGQSTQIGFVLMLGILVAAFSMYQSTVIPDQNAGIEFIHNQQVQKQVLDLRNNILGVGSRNSAKGSVLEMAPRYPTRLVGFNPRDPAGRLYTIGAEEQDINVRLYDANIIDMFGAPISTTQFNTGIIVYAPNYNEYPSAPETVYDQTTVYNKYEDSVSRLTGQTLIDGNEINIRYFDSRINRVTTRTAVIDVKYEQRDSYQIEAEGDLQLAFSSYAPPEAWEFLEETEPNVPEDGVTGLEQDDTEADIHRVQVDLVNAPENGGEYTVEATKVVIQSRIP